MLSKGEPLLPPEASELLKESIKHAKQKNLVATAVVFEDVKYKYAVKAFWERIYTSASLTFSFFDNLNEAEHWLNQQL